MRVTKSLTSGLEATWDAVIMYLYLEYCVQFWNTQYKGHMDLLEQAQRRATKITRSLEDFSCEDGLRGLRLFSVG